MEPNLTIRSPIEADFEQWRALWQNYNAFYGRAGNTALPENIVQTTWKRFLDEAQPLYCLVAEYDGKLIGLAHYIFHPNTITIEPTCYLQDLFSEPSMRGKGIGRALIAEFYEQARRAGTTGVYWHTHSTNENAMKLYDKLAVNTQFVVYRKSL